MTYARFNDSAYKYNNASRLYGAGTESTNLIWMLQIDWDGDGAFDGTNEAAYMIDCNIKRGRDFYIKVDGDGKASGFEPMKVGRLKVVLHNNDKRYDAYNTTSPLYPNILPGRYINLSVNYNGTVYSLFAGKVIDIQAEGGDQPKVIITAEDGLRRLQDFDASVTVQEDIDIDNAVSLVLDDVDYPALWGRNIEDTSDILSYWWADDRAKTEIQRLSDAELGSFFIANDGKATYYSRHHTNSALLTLTSADLLKEVTIPQPWEVVRNIVKVVAHPAILETGVVLWTLADAPVINAGSTFTVWASYNYNSQPTSGLNIVTPASSTDFTVNTLANGTGTDLTASCSITTFTDFGKTAKIVLKNNSVSNGYVTLLQVRGDAITFPDPSIQIAEDTASQALYDPRTFVLDSEWLQSTALAGSFASFIGSFLSTPQRFLTVQLEASPTNQFSPDLADVIDMTITALSVDGNYKIGSVEHEWLTQNGQAVLTTWKLEPYPDTSGYWQFPTQIGITSIFGI